MMISAITDTLNKLRTLTQCQQVTLGVHSSEPDEIAIDFIHVEDNTEYSISILCSEDEFATTSVTEIVAVFNNELSTQKAQHNNHKDVEITECK